MEIMNIENFDHEIPETANLQETQPESPFKCMIKKTEGFYLFDEKDRKYLDLTSNNDHFPLGFLQSPKTSGFFDSECLKSEDALNLETIIKEKTTYDGILFFPEKQELQDFLKKVIDSKPQNSVLISSLENYKLDLTGKKIAGIPLNDESPVKTFINKNTAAVILQIAQIKDSLEVAEIDYLKLVRQYCSKNNALLIYDTCSISPLRLNRGLFNVIESIKPDLIMASRGLTLGTPFYTAIFDKSIVNNEQLTKKTGIFSCGYFQANEFIKNFESYELYISEISKYIEKKFGELAEIHIAIADFIPHGMIFELVSEIPSWEFAKAAFEKGLLLKPLSQYKTLLCPPYNIDKKEIDRAIEIIHNILEEMSLYGRLD